MMRRAVLLDGYGTKPKIFRFLSKKTKHDTFWKVIDTNSTGEQPLSQHTKLCRRTLCAHHHVRFVHFYSLLGLGATTCGACLNNYMNARHTQNIISFIQFNERIRICACVCYILKRSVVAIGSSVVLPAPLIHRLLCLTLSL